MTYRLFLDDERDPADKDVDMVLVRSFEEFKQALDTLGSPYFVSFDHDLGDGPTGYDAAKYLVELDHNANGGFIPFGFSFYVHSQNPVGCANIQGYLDHYLHFRKELPDYPAHNQFTYILEHCVSFDGVGAGATLECTENPGLYVPFGQRVNLRLEAEKVFREWLTDCKKAGKKMKYPLTKFQDHNPFHQVPVTLSNQLSWDIAAHAQSLKRK